MRAVQSNRTTIARRGLTLVEVMIVVVVMAIVGVLAAPMFAATNATRLDAAGKLLVADLQFAQMYALSHAGTRCGVKITSGNTGYSVVTNSAQPFNCTAATELTDIIADQNYTTTFGSGRGSPAAGVTIGTYALGGDACVAFGALGELDQATAATITLQLGGNTRTVSIDPVSGAATLSP